MLIPKLSGGTKARLLLFLGIPDDSLSRYLTYGNNAGVAPVVSSVSYDDSFVRRLCRINLYDQARAIDSAKHRGTAFCKKPVVVPESAFEEPDDSLVRGVLRHLLHDNTLRNASGVATSRRLARDSEESSEVIVNQEQQ